MSYLPFWVYFSEIFFVVDFWGQGFSGRFCGFFVRGVVFMGIFAEGLGLYIFARRPGGGRVIGASLRWRSLFFWWDFGVFFAW